MHTIDDTHLKRYGQQHDGVEQRGSDKSFLHVSCAQADQSHQIHWHDWICIISYARLESV